MKKIISLLFITSSLFITQHIAAQNKTNADFEEIIEKQVEQLGTELKLDNLQKALLKANLKEYNSKALKIIESDEPKEDIQQSMMLLKEKQKKDLLVFLNEEEIKVFEKFQKKEQKRNRSAIRRQRIKY